MSRSRRPSLRRAPLTGVLLLALAACGGSDALDSATAHDITGVMPNLAFHLTSENGGDVTAERYRGRAVVLFFGYTHCPMICPATMARMRAALAGLSDAQRRRIAVLFVSVDPERDPPTRLKQWTAAFGPEFVGLTGTPTQLTALTKRYNVTYGYGRPNARGFYTVSHSSALFVFDADGRVRLLANQDETIDQITADLKRLLAVGGGRSSSA